MFGVGQSGETSSSTQECGDSRHSPWCIQHARAVRAPRVVHACHHHHHHHHLHHHHGQERFNSMHPAYYHLAHACILCFDVTRKQTYKNLPDWHTELA